MEICFAIARGATGRSSMPCANCHSCTPTTPPREISTSLRLMAASCPMVSTPMAPSFCCVTGPAPHSLPTGNGWISSPNRSCGTTKVPSGFASPEAIFAACFPAPAPIELGRPVSSRITRRRFSAHSWTSSGAAPASAAGSMNASSMESCSMSPAWSAMMPKTRREAAEYTARRGVTTTAW